MKSLLFVLVASLAFATTEVKPTEKPAEPAKTDAAKGLPAVDKEAAAKLNQLIVEGQSYQLQIDTLEKQYRDLSGAANQNLAERQQLIIDTVKASGQDPDKITINVNVKGQAAYGQLPDKPKK